jgi:raffinose/stachyose/melibiose transport system substrate-binding protein
MRKVKKIWILTLVAILMVSMLLMGTSCKGAEEEPAAPAEEPAAEEPAAEEPAPEEKEPVTITWWHIQTEESQKAYWQDLADRFMDANPHVTIEITVMENENFKAKMTTVMQTGEVPDLFQSWGGGTMNAQVEAGLLKDITAELAEDGFADTISPGALGVYSYNGKNYGVPRDMGMVGIFYNTELFEQAGVEAPIATWSDLLEAVDKFNAAGITPIAEAAGDKWPAAFSWEYLVTRIGGQAAFDAAANTRTGSFTDEPFVQAGYKLLELVDAKAYQDGFLAATWGDAATIMGNGEAAMNCMGQWGPGSYRENSADGKGIDDKLGWFPFPMVEGGAGNPNDALGGGNGFVVGKDAPDEAVDFLKFMLTVEEQNKQTELGMGVPVVKGATVEDPILLQIIEGRDKAEYLQLYYDQYLPPAMGSVVNDIVQGIMAKAMTPEEACQMLEDSAVENLD